MIWGCGRDARRFFRALRVQDQQRVRAFVEIDKKKLRKGVFHTHPPYRCDIAARLARDRGLPPPAKKTASTWKQVSIPIVPANDKLAVPPVVACVTLDRDNGIEDDLEATGWKLGVDIYQFY